MSFQPTPEGIVDARANGYLKDLLLDAAGITPQAPRQRTAEPEAPCYHIPRPGAWPCGTAATGPTPKPCARCAPPEEPR
ncbi:hypothetical protein [Streptomyces sp. NBC_01353]|uniref:hypothetical protein n=1 Tax=Streptomyces sp. NBC_01353 TaxID=2903835 RepID=UPI002E2EB382|nr:hypothetical protein [Streptomyces sp. NBC_01353]